MIASPINRSSRVHGNAESAGRNRAKHPVVTTIGSMTNRIGCSRMERPVRFRAVREIGARQSVADPKQGGQTEVKQIEWTRLRIRIAMDEQQHDRREPKRAEHPEPVPKRSTYPGRRPFPRPWCCRSDLKYGGG